MYNRNLAEKYQKWSINVKFHRFIEGDILTFDVMVNQITGSLWNSWSENINYSYYREGIGEIFFGSFYSEIFGSQYRKMRVCSPEEDFLYLMMNGKWPEKNTQLEFRFMK